MIVGNASEALEYFKAGIVERHMAVSEVRRVPTGDGFYHPQIITETKELYHLKFTKEPYRPKETARVSAGARELDEKLKHAIYHFGNGEDTLIGVNDSVILNILESQCQFSGSYFVTVVGDGRILWRRAQEFYDFVLRHDTFIKFARQNAPQAMVPTGWLTKWQKPLSAVGILCVQR